MTPADRSPTRRPVLAALGIACLAGGAWFGWQGDPSGGPGEAALETFLGASWTDAEGRPFDSAALRGRALVLNFWATWCPPCIEELPLLDALHQRSGADGLQVIGIALDDPAAVEKFLGEVPVEFPMFLAKPGRVDLSTTLGNANSVLPYSVLIDAEGRIAKRKFGAFSEASLREWVAGFE